MDPDVQWLVRPWPEELQKQQERGPDPIKGAKAAKRIHDKYDSWRFPRIIIF
jgi:hypothetical protein